MRGGAAAVAHEDGRSERERRADERYDDIIWVFLVVEIECNNSSANRRGGQRGSRLRCCVGGARLAGDLRS